MTARDSCAGGNVSDGLSKACNFLIEKWGLISTCCSGKPACFGTLQQLWIARRFGYVHWANPKSLLAKAVTTQASPEIAQTLFASLIMRLSQGSCVPHARCRIPESSSGRAAAGCEPDAPSEGTIARESPDNSSLAEEGMGGAAVTTANGDGAIPLARVPA